MPYNIRRHKNKYEIVKADTGKVVGTSTTRADAEASIRARHAGAHNKNWKKH